MTNTPKDTQLQMTARNNIRGAVERMSEHRRIVYSYVRIGGKTVVNGKAVKA